MYIAFYISSHGFGHMTRCLSLIEYLLKNSDFNIYIACNKFQNDFARTYLEKYKDRVIYRDFITDIGFINKKNSLEVDVKTLEGELLKFINTWDTLVLEECKNLKNLNIKCIVTDISPIGCLVGKKLKLKTILISNFTWVDQYEFLGINKSIISKFREAYSYVDKLIKYDLSLPMDSIKPKSIENAGFICREVDLNRVKEISDKYGNIVFITCGKSANLNSIRIENFNGTIITTSGIDIISNEGANIFRLPIDVLDTQNYIAASDIVITKAGWGTIGECLIGQSNMVLIERPSAREDSFNIEEIKKNKLGISISESELSCIDISKIRENLNNIIDYEKLSSYKNDVEKIIKIINV